LTASTINAPVVLNWYNSVKATSWHVKRATVSGGPYTTIATTTNTSYDDTTAAQGTRYFYVVSAVDSTGESANSAEVTASPTPNPWANIDVGTVGLAGSGSISDDAIFTQEGAGTTVAGTTEAFNFTYKTMTGDGSLIARAVSISQPNGKFGITMRESLSTGSRSVSAVFNSNGVWYQAQAYVCTTTGGSIAAYNSGIAGVPVWVKITRAGNVFTTYASATGTAGTWTTISTSTIAMASTVYIGTVAASGYTTQLDETTIDNVTAVCDAPAGVTESASTGQITVGWSACLGAASYNVKRATTSGGPYTTIASVASPNINYSDTTVAANTNYYYVVSAVNAAGESLNSAELRAWNNADFGTYALAGSVSTAASGVITAVGSGSNLGGTAEGSNFTYHMLTGDGTMIARVTSMSLPNAKAGVMMRETLTAGSKAVATIYNNNGVWLQAQTMVCSTTGGTPLYTSGTTMAMPCWVKVARVGNVFTTYCSSDGVTWTTINTNTITMASTIYVGLVDCSCSSAHTIKAVFDNVSGP
jgi:regulation of enolase protein 1 (concanavalin A-like superfamily)